MTAMWQEQLGLQIEGPFGQPLHLTLTNSTDHTVSGQRGPGRTLDALLENVGGRFDRLLEDTAEKLRARKKRGKGSGGQVDSSNDGHAQHNSDDAGLEVFFEGGKPLEITETNTTNETTSDNRGLGRTTDRMIGAVARIFDIRLQQTAHKLGYGPVATSAYLEAQRTQLGAVSLSMKQKRRLIKKCRRLLKYTTSQHTVATKYQALLSITHLASLDTHLQYCFISIGAYEHLRSVRNILMNCGHIWHYKSNNDCSMLLSACWRALHTVIDDDANKVARELQFILALRGVEVLSEALIHADKLLWRLWEMLDAEQEGISVLGKGSDFRRLRKWYRAHHRLLRTNINENTLSPLERLYRRFASTLVKTWSQDARQPMDQNPQIRHIGLPHPQTSALATQILDWFTNIAINWDVSPSTASTSANSANCNATFKPLPSNQLGLAFTSIRRVRSGNKSRGKDALRICIDEDAGFFKVSICLKDWGKMTNHVFEVKQGRVRKWTLAKHLAYNSEVQEHDLTSYVKFLPNV